MGAAARGSVRLVIAQRRVELDRYTAGLFAKEDDVLTAVRDAQDAAQLPPIAISPEEGKTLHVLLTAIGARRVLEVGTLGGYSGVWIARALPAGGKLTTIEIDPGHAAVARRAFQAADLADRIELIEGKAADVLPRMTPPFDAVFLDADKANLPRYYDEAMRLLRLGGLLLCDNAFKDGEILDRENRGPDVVGVRAINAKAAADPRLASVIIPVRDGLLVGVKVAA